MIRPQAPLIDGKQILVPLLYSNLLQLVTKLGAMGRGQGRKEQSQRNMLSYRRTVTKDKALMSRYDIQLLTDCDSIRSDCNLPSVDKALMSRYDIQLLTDCDSIRSDCNLPSVDKALTSRYDIQLLSGCDSIRSDCNLPSVDKALMSRYDIQLV